MDRFDLDNLDTAAIRDLEAAKDDLEAAVAKRQEQERAIAETMTVAELKGAVSAVHGFTLKADWVEAYVKQEVAAAPEAKRLAELRAEAGDDRHLARTLNEMLDAADEDVTDLSGVAPHARIAVVQRNLINKYVGRHARSVLDTVNGGYADLRAAALDEYLTTIKIVLNYVGTSVNGFGQGLRDREEIIAANKFRDDLRYRLPNLPMTSDMIG